MSESIQVTQEHIRKGRPAIKRYCPVALALHDAGYLNARVGVFDVYITASRSLDIVGTPVYEWIRRFDEGKPVEPFEFDLDALAPERFT